MKKLSFAFPFDFLLGISLTLARSGRVNPEQKFKRDVCGETSCLTRLETTVKKRPRQAAPKKNLGGGGRRRRDFFPGRRRPAAACFFPGRRRPAAASKKISLGGGGRRRRQCQAARPAAAWKKSRSGNTTSILTNSVDFFFDPLIFHTSIFACHL